MRPTQHPSNNQAIAGFGDHVAPLAVTRFSADAEGPAMLCSYWRPTKEELAALNRGGLIRLSVMGESMPPVAMDVP